MPEVPAIACPWCGVMQDFVTPLSGEEGPRPGSVTICLSCTGANLFTEGLGLRRLEPADLADWPEAELARLRQLKQWVLVRAVARN